MTFLCAEGCQHIAATFGGDLFAQTSHIALPHLFRTKKAPVFTHGLALFFAHLCWTHLHKQVVLSACAIFFVLHPWSTKNVAAKCMTGRFCGQRQVMRLSARACA